MAAFAKGSLARLSQVVARLEKRGWIRRTPDPDDGRFTLAILTDTGRDKVVATAPGHVAEVQRLVFDALTRAQQRQLHDIGRRIVRVIDPDDPCLGQPPFRTEQGPSNSRRRYRGSSRRVVVTAVPVTIEAAPSRAPDQGCRRERQDRSMSSRFAGRNTAQTVSGSLVLGDIIQIRGVAGDVLVPRTEILYGIAPFPTASRLSPGSSEPAAEPSAAAAVPGCAIRRPRPRAG